VSGSIGHVHLGRQQSLRIMTERGIMARSDSPRSYKDPTLETAYHIGHDIFQLARGPWKTYIEERSGVPFHLSF
jgi:hypothetical protein